MNVAIECTYRANDHPKSVTFQSDYMQLKDALFVAEDLVKTGRIVALEFIEDTGLRFSKKELEKTLKTKDTKPHNIVTYFDGGYHHNERLAGLGVAIYFEQNDKQHRIRKNEAFKHLESNNEAEYAALWLVLLQLEELQVEDTSVTFKGDSKVVFNQLEGKWPSYEETLNQWAGRIEEKLKQLKITPVYEMISRERNKEAHKLATQALNGVPISSRLHIDSDDKGTDTVD
jgi:ribonuclease HI